MEGVELAARFALPPNSKGYCGKKEFAKSFGAYLKGRNSRNRTALRKGLEQFTAHFAYLKLISAASGLQPFDDKIAEALWIGSRQLEKVKRQDLQRLVETEFSGEGMLTRQRAAELASEVKKGFLPHHSFHVLCIHTISGVLEPSVGNADLCRISWGRVARTGREFVEVATQRLTEKNGRLSLLPCRKRWKTACAGIALVPDAKVGDILASHWGVAVMKITREQAKRLEKYTRANIAAV